MFHINMTPPPPFAFPFLAVLSAFFLLLALGFGLFQHSVRNIKFQQLHHAQHIVYAAAAAALNDQAPCLMVDVGANMGYMTLFAASLGHRVHAFEPVDQFYRLVAMAVMANRVCFLHIHFIIPPSPPHHTRLIAIVI
jgi:hypothetical protein